jgi:hypothetical protein
MLFRDPLVIRRLPALVVIRRLSALVVIRRLPALVVIRRLPALVVIRRLPALGIRVRVLTCSPFVHVDMRIPRRSPLPSATPNPDLDALRGGERLTTVSRNRNVCRHADADCECVWRFGPHWTSPATSIRYAHVIIRVPLRVPRSTRRSFSLGASTIVYVPISTIDIQHTCAPRRVYTSSASSLSDFSVPGFDDDMNWSCHVPVLASSKPSRVGYMSNTKALQMSPWTCMTRRVVVTFHPSALKSKPRAGVSPPCASHNDYAPPSTIGGSMELDALERFSCVICDSLTLTPPGQTRMKSASVSRRVLAGIMANPTTFGQMKFSIEQARLYSNESLGISSGFRRRSCR